MNKIDWLEWQKKVIYDEYVKETKDEAESKKRFMDLDLVLADENWK